MIITRIKHRFGLDIFIKVEKIVLIIGQDQ